MNEERKVMKMVSPIKCYNCEYPMEGKTQNYAYSECGLSSVVLTNIIVFHCSQCGAIVPEIPSVGGLHLRIAMDTLFKKSLLISEEIRFVRKMAGYSATHLSKVMGVDKSTVSRWENSKNIGKNNDRVLRLICFAKLIFNAVGKDGSQADKMGEIARAVKSLDLDTLLQAIENKIKGPLHHTIDPSEPQSRNLMKIPGQASMHVQ